MNVINKFISRCPLEWLAVAIGTWTWFLMLTGNGS